MTAVPLGASRPQLQTCPASRLAVRRRHRGGLAASGALWYPPNPRGSRHVAPTLSPAASFEPRRAGRGVASCPFRLSAFFPAYNDAGTIASMVVTADRTLRALTDDYEIIVVNDGSPDHTGEVLADLQTRYPHLRVVTHQKNRGYGGALRSGFANATKDADLLHRRRRPVRPARVPPAGRAPDATTWTWCRGTRSSATTRSSGSSSAGSTTPSCGRCSACRSATWTATCG